MHGKGVYSWPGIKQCYVGQWKEGKRHGHGRHYFNSSCPDVDDNNPTMTAGGDYYDGEWKEGVMHGKARYVDAGGEEHEGLWVDGVCPEVVRCEARQKHCWRWFKEHYFPPCTSIFFDLQLVLTMTPTFIPPHVLEQFPLFFVRISRTCRKMEAFGTASR